MTCVSSFKIDTRPEHCYYDYIKTIILHDGTQMRIGTIKPEASYCLFVIGDQNLSGSFWVGSKDILNISEEIRSAEEIKSKLGNLI